MLARCSCKWRAALSVLYKTLVLQWPHYPHCTDGEGDSHRDEGACSEPRRQKRGWGGNTTFMTRPCPLPPHVLLPAKLTSELPVVIRRTEKEAETKTQESLFLVLLEAQVAHDSS